ncbi:hypothetical protein [uncultured Pseudacidovorax sp.]|uniref:hypothetical protein n=1 Tax=uncultured Pseudacidovorax sp. TaxID=679313 RepID=UPI0025FCB59D|nr:hypothetical protein [uncultured Pseudacidovorax sp.]
MERDTLILLLVAVVWTVAALFLCSLAAGGDARRLGEQDPEEADALERMKTNPRGLAGVPHGEASGRPTPPTRG